MKNEQATQGIENLKKTYEDKYNMDTLFLWLFDKHLTINNNNEIIHCENKIDFIYCNKCKEIIGKKDEYDNILFNKFFLNLIDMDLIIDNNENIKVNINNFFSVDYLNILLNKSITKGNNFLKFLNIKNKSEIIFETKINILGLIKKNCDDDDNKFIINFLIDNYVNMFEIKYSVIKKDELWCDNSNNIILNDKDFNLLEKIIQDNIDLYFSELFFYKLLTNENKRFYLLSLPRKKN